MFRRLAALGFFVAFVSVALAQSPEPERTSPEVTSESAADDENRWIGINGCYRVGRWTPIRLPSTSPRTPASSTNVSPPLVTLQTTDGDGATVIYQQPEDIAAKERFAYAIPGSEAAPLIIRRDGVATLRTRFAESGVPADQPSMIAESMPWVMVFGEPLGIETIGANELLNRPASVAVTVVKDAQMIPDTSLGLRCIDLIVITRSGADALSKCDDRQQKALRDWVLGGGRVIVSLGSSFTQTLQAAPWLADLLPDQVRLAGGVELDPAGIEAFISSQTRLQSYTAIALPKTIGRTGVGRALINGRTTRRVSAILAANYVAGFGEITVIAADLESKDFQAWPQRLDLVTRLAGGALTGTGEDVAASVRLGGFADLTGQTRRTLDQFSIQRSFDFSVIALIISGLIALVAPLDYLLMRKLESRSIVGWITFPIVALAISIGLIIAAQPQTSVLESTSNVNTVSTQNDTLLRSNSFEFLDIDVPNQFAQLFRWNYLYSHPARNVDVSVSPADGLRPLIQQVDHQIVHPFGYPGFSMGGIQVESSGGSSRVVLQRRDDALLGSIEDLSMAPRSSQSLAVSMQFQTELKAEALQRRSGSELLQGSLQNPLGVDLLEAMLIHRNWVYLLPTRFPAGDVIADIDQLRQKNFRWQLSRQRAMESTSETEKWDVLATNQPQRLSEMLMFHDAVGGSRYTSLRNDILSRLDFSDLLHEERAILVARVADQWTNLRVSEVDSDDSTNESLGDVSGQRTTWVRLVLDVQD